MAAALGAGRAPGTRTVAPSSPLPSAHWNPSHQPAANEVAVMYEDEVNVHMRLHEREEVFVPLGITVSASSRSSGGPMRAVHVRLTDPRDPFFLYSVTISEEDYGRFKDKHELLVDFNGFPRDLTSMIQAASANQGFNQTISPGHGESGFHSGGLGVNASTGSAGLASSQPHEVHFVTTSTDGLQGVLRIMERTDFRSLEHVSLVLQRQNDVGQKCYLAERFKHFEAAFRTSEATRHDEVAKLSRMVDETKAEADRLAAERDALRDRLLIDGKENETARISCIAELNATHNRDVRNIQADHERERTTLIERHDAAVKALQEHVQKSDDTARKLEQRVTEVEHSEASLQSNLKAALDEGAAHARDVQRLLADNRDLHAFRIDATRYRTEAELAQVSTSERLKHLTETLLAREAEMKTLKSQHDSQAQFATLLAQQLEESKAKNNVTEQGLAKSHHIIGNQLSALKGAKDKIASLQSQVAALETAIAERGVTAERMRNESLLGKDRLDQALSSVAELRDQLQKSEDNNAKLAAQLKQNEEALVHLHRLGSAGGGLRSWASLTTAHSSLAHSQPPPAAASALPRVPPPSAAFQSFARGETTAATATVALPSRYGHGGMLASDGDAHAGSPPPRASPPATLHQSFGGGVGLPAGLSYYRGSSTGAATSTQPTIASAPLSGPPASSAYF